MNNRVGIGFALGCLLTLLIVKLAPHPTSQSSVPSLPPYDFNGRTALMVGSLAEPVSAPYITTIALSEQPTCLYVDREEMLVKTENLGVRGDVEALVIRGYAGTVALPHAAGSMVYKGFCDTSKPAH